MMRKFVLLLVLGFMSGAYAGEVTLTWTPPTENEDGSLISASCTADPTTCLAGYKMYQSDVPGGPYVEVADIANPSTTSYVVQNLTDGTYYFVSTAYNASGTESAYSNEASKVVQTVPQPPSNLVADGNLVAYAVSMSEDVFLTYPVGTVMAGTACDPSMSANGMYLVPRSSVTFAGGADAYVVFAECGTQ